MAISEILKTCTHRPYELPEGNWAYYQEWNRALFFHWQVPFEMLRKLVPPALQIDSFEGNCYVSLVAFTMENIRPRYLPSIDFISNFDELNVRTYVEHDHKKGVFFLNIEAARYISTLLAKSISGLPYEKAIMKRSPNTYVSINPRKGFKLDAGFQLGADITHKSALDTWLTERYCLYLEREDELYRYDIHHEEWKLKQLELKQLNLHYSLGEINLGERLPDFVHYSDGIKVIAWERKKI